MRTSSLTWIPILTHIRFVCLEVVYLRGAERGSAELPCVPESEQAGGAPTGVSLRFRISQVLREVLSMTEDKKVRVSPVYHGRVTVTVGPASSSQFNVTIFHLQRSDTGIYTCEFTYATSKTSDQVNPTDHQAISNSQEVFLFVDDAGRSCECSRYAGLLYIISAGVGAFLITLICLCAMECVSEAKHTKDRSRQKPQPPAPIYEEMNSGCQNDGSLQHMHPGPSQLEEMDSPVYANSRVKQTQNYYASPRQISIGV